MKAIVCTKWGTPDVLQLREVEKPVPKGDEVLIKIFATTVTAGDCEIRGFKINPMIWLTMRIAFGFRGPRKKILGQDLAGEIEAVGKFVKLFKKGDQVFGSTGMGFGAYAQYRCLRQNATLAIKPANMTYEEAATVPTGGLNALSFLLRANIQSGQKILINGAGGTIGTIAIQLAKNFGAEVTGVDSTGKLDMLRSIGADQVIDYTKEDFTKSGQSYDFIFDVVGKGPFSGCIRSLKKNGLYLLANPRQLHIIRGIWTNMISSKKVIFPASGMDTEDLTEDLIYLKELIEEGKIKTVIDKRYPLEQTAEAHRYVETGQKAGNVIINVEHTETQQNALFA